MEKRLQTKVVKWLREQGCYVIKTPGGVAGIPTGCPDVIALLPSGLWAALEIKASAAAKKQPLQQETIDKLSGMGYSSFVHPDNWLDVRHDLARLIKGKPLA